LLIQASAPGKLILIGEYAVLEGSPALVCAVNRYANVTLSESKNNFYMISAESIGIENVPFLITNNNLILFDRSVDSDTCRRLTFFKNIFEYTWQYFKSTGIPHGPFHIRIDTTSFYSAEQQTKLGFGSSAAMTMALVRAISKFAGENIDDEGKSNRMFRLALAAHRKAQGNVGSGIDIAASAFGGVLQYTVGINEQCEQIMPQTMAVWDDLPFLIVFTGSSESTRRMVAGVGDLKKNTPDIYTRLINRLAETSTEGCRCYTLQDKRSFLNTVKEYYDLMNELGTKSGMPIISEVHQKIASIVQQNNGVYKPSGAGSGDIGIAFTDTFEDLANIRREAEKNGFVCIDAKIADKITN